jgi:hypothetical protein
MWCLVGHDGAQQVYCEQGRLVYRATCREYGRMGTESEEPPKDSRG